MCTVPGLQHHVGAVGDTDALRAHAEAAFRGARREDRPRFRSWGKDAHNPRDALWYARPAADGMLPLYRVYSTAYASPSTAAGLATAAPPAAMPEWLCAVLDRISAAHGLPALNHVVLHRYVDHRDGIGWHRDKYMDFAPGSSIVSLSLGATRRFEVRAGARHDRLAVADGDLVVLSYECNRAAKHRVPPTATPAGVRYSITARTVDTHFDPERRVFRHRDAPAAVAY
jgi:hypothetical protein